MAAKYSGPVLIERKRINEIRELYPDNKLVIELCDHLANLLDENTRLVNRCDRMFREAADSNKRYETLVTKLTEVIHGS